MEWINSQRPSWSTQSFRIIKSEHHKAFFLINVIHLISYALISSDSHLFSLLYYRIAPITFIMLPSLYTTALYVSWLHSIALYFSAVLMNNNEGYILIYSPRCLFSHMTSIVIRYHQPIHVCSSLD